MCCDLTKPIDPLLRSFTNGTVACFTNIRVLLWCACVDRLNRNNSILIKHKAEFLQGTDPGEGNGTIWSCKSRLRQESPPAWTQEAHHPRVASARFADLSPDGGGSTPSSLGWGYRSTSRFQILVPPPSRPGMAVKKRWILKVGTLMSFYSEFFKKRYHFNCVFNSPTFPMAKITKAKKQKARMTTELQWGIQKHCKMACFLLAKSWNPHGHLGCLDPTL